MLFIVYHTSTQVACYVSYHTKHSIQKKHTFSTPAALATNWPSNREPGNTSSSLAWKTVSLSTKSRPVPLSRAAILSLRWRCVCFGSRESGAGARTRDNDEANAKLRDARMKSDEERRIAHRVSYVQKLAQIKKNETNGVIFNFRVNAGQPLAETFRRRKMKKYRWSFGRWLIGILVVWIFGSKLYNEMIRMFATPQVPVYSATRNLDWIPVQYRQQSKTGW